MSGKRDESLLLDDIIQAATRLVTISAALPPGRLGTNPDIDETILWNLTLLGEASKRLSETTRERYPHIPWRHFSRTRDFLIHHYEGIDWQLIEEICTIDLPALILDLLEARERIRAEFDAD